MSLSQPQWAEGDCTPNAESHQHQVGRGRNNNRGAEMKRTVKSGDHHGNAHGDRQSC